MSRVKNEGLMMHYKSVTDNMLTVVGHIFEPNTAIEEPKGSLEANLSIRKPPIVITSSNTVISPSIYRILFFDSNQSIG